MTQTVVNRMEGAVKLTRETALLLAWLIVLAKTVSTQALYVFIVRSAIIDICYPNPDDLQNVKAPRQEILTMTLKTDP